LPAEGSGETAQWPLLAKIVFCPKVPYVPCPAEFEHLGRDAAENSLESV
jgi:hypothetical protein